MRRAHAGSQDLPFRPPALALVRPGPVRRRRRRLVGRRLAVAGRPWPAGARARPTLARPTRPSGACAGATGPGAGSQGLRLGHFRLGHDDGPVFNCWCWVERLLLLGRERRRRRRRRVARPRGREAERRSRGRRRDRVGRRCRAAARAVEVRRGGGEGVKGGWGKDGPGRMTSSPMRFALRPREKRPGMGITVGRAGGHKPLVGLRSEARGTTSG